MRRNDMHVVRLFNEIIQRKINYKFSLYKMEFINEKVYCQNICENIIFNRNNIISVDVVNARIY